jgi:uncharacterized membrane protein|tara:strand:+ start:1011 stop:1481 length:471 start_codon:yes stop_codon:yes gene_type:complete
VWSIQSHNKALYAGLLIATLFLSLAAMGPGLFSDASNTLISWQHNIFKVLCHQDPARSFSVSGVKMAVCSRCLGIYAALLVGTLIMPVYSLLSGSTINTEKNWLIAAILLNLADVSGNYFGFWTNTMISRFILGCIVGLPVILILTNEFFTINKSE